MQAALDMSDALKAAHTHAIKKRNVKGELQPFAEAPRQSTGAIPLMLHLQVSLEEALSTLSPLALSRSL